MLPTYESKTTGHKFNGRKGVGDEVLELPIGIMQDNTEVSWLATRGLSPLPQGPWEQTQQHAVLMPRAFGNKQSNIPWFRGYAGVLIPRAFGKKQNNIPWFRGYAGVLIPRAFGNKHNNVPWFPGYAGLWEQSQQQLQHWGSHSPRKADHVSLWGKRATCTEHFIPSRCLFSSGK